MSDETVRVPPRRTRDEGTEDEAEAYEAFVNWYGADVGGPTSYEMKQTFVAGCRRSLIDAADAIQALHPGEVKNSVIWLRARAARLAGEDD